MARLTQNKLPWLLVPLLALALWLLLLLPAMAQASPCVNQSTGAPLVHLTWSAPTTLTNGAPITAPVTYSVYVGTAAGQETLYGSVPTTYLTIKNLQHGQGYYFYVVAVSGGKSSAPSVEACKTFYKE